MDQSRRTFLRNSAIVTGSLTLGSSARLVFGDEEAKKNTDDISIDGDFPGGNIVVERIDGGQVDLHQDFRDTDDWFYWYFRVRGAAGRTITFRFTKGNPITARGPAVSIDRGETWSWTGSECVHGATFTYTFPAEADEVRFCLAIPYQEKNLLAFLARYKEHEHLLVEPHCQTKRGRTTRRLRVGNLGENPRYRLLFTCRHHSCEMMASWVLEGLLGRILSYTDDGRWFCENIQAVVVPFMDKDGVEDGDQGKNRRPHDHNRDYLGESIYPSTAELRKFIPQWSKGRLDMSLDLHCPWIRGESDERVFLVGGRNQKVWEQIVRFSKIIQQAQTGPLQYAPEDNIPWGVSWNKRKVPSSCSAWAANLPGIQIATTVEFPYANIHGIPTSIENSRQFGGDLAHAIRQYLETL